MADEVREEIRELRASVEAFRARVESLEANVESLETDNARLREARSNAVAPDRADVPVDRRHLLKLAGKSAVVGTGLAAGAALLGGQPAAADHLPGFGHVNNTGAATTGLYGNGPSPAFQVVNDGSGQAIFAAGVEGSAVYTFSQRSNALTARISGTNGFNAVYAQSAAPGNAVFGEVTSLGPGNAVLGIHRGPGNCVFGFKPGGVTGDAVVGYSQTANSRGVLGLSTNGRGGAFSGKAAQVQLLASTATTHPTSGLRGDLFVDNSGRLWFCKGGTTWRQLA